LSKGKNELNCCRYATVYTNFPVFSLVLDKDVSPEIAMTYPELYKDLTKVLKLCSFSFRAFVFVWVVWLISRQGCHVGPMHWRSVVCEQLVVGCYLFIYLFIIRFIHTLNYSK